MTTKPPSSLAAGDAPNLETEDDDDDLLVDASDDVTVEASEEVTTEAASAGLASVPSDTPSPVFAEPAESVAVSRPAAAPTLLGIPLSSIPLPGVIAPGSQGAIEIAKEPVDEEEVTRLSRPVNDEVTRPSITEEDEEETKVEATDPLGRIDDGSDDVTTALAEQASVEREKALRRSSPSLPASAMPPSGDSGVEFSDPDDDAVMGDDAIDEEAPDDSTANYTESAQDTSSPLAAAITRRPPPGAPFGRLPSPSSSFGLSLSPAPVGQVPAPSSSPFASRLTGTTGTPPFGGRTTTASSPAVQIPAPSAAAPVAARTSPLFKIYSIPLLGLVTVGAATLIFGMIIGAAIFGGTPPTVAVAPAPAPTPATAPLVHPIAVTPPPPAKSPETAIAEPPPAEPLEPKPVKRAAAPAPRPRKLVDPLDEEQAQAQASTPRAARPAPKPPAPPAAKPVVKKPTKPWVDPFAN